jgi:pilus assembly protein TadC
MSFRIPFTRLSIDKLKQKSRLFSPYVPKKKKSKLSEYLEDASVPLSREEYLGLVIRSGVTVLIAGYVFLSTLFFFLNIKSWYLTSLLATLMFVIFVSGSQMLYPQLYNSRKQRNIERNLIPALEDILVQLNSGIPLFSILVNISSSDYGELSVEFKRAVKKINTGVPQIEALEELGKRNNSPFFRRTIWQISNGMKAGSDISVVIKEGIYSLNEEQVLQIQTYGNKLNPLIMFYMLVSVILPALSITFLTVISSLINLSRTITLALFSGLFILVIIIQIMFMGMMRSIRPSLL